MKDRVSDILVMESVRSVALVFQGWIRKFGLRTEIVEDGKVGIEKLRTGQFNLAVIDLDLDGISGLEILKLARQENIATNFIVVTANGSVNLAVEAMRLGAHDFLIKPVAEDRLLSSVREGLSETDMQPLARRRVSKKIAKQQHGFIGSSSSVINLCRMIDAVSRSSASVFITGESGTGKEVCAQAVHSSSPRKDGPFIPLNCAAIPKDLMESEIFGHVPGAFTGATSERSGAAASANYGTLFLDEICEMDLALQSKLLRFLQTGTYRKVGSDRHVKVDVRIVCATNRNPIEEVREGRFREDLFYRLHVLPLHLPPLRERGSDAVEIAKYFLRIMSEEEGKAFTGFSDDAEDALLSYLWPGNIRELQNIIRKAVILHDGELLTEKMLGLEHQNLFMSSMRNSAILASNKTVMVSLEQDFADIERDIIEAAILHCGNSIPKASDMLHLSPSTIYRKKEAWT